MQYIGASVMFRINILDGFIVCALADLFTYLTTSLELALAYPAEVGGYYEFLRSLHGSSCNHAGPLAIVEGVVLALVFKYIVQLKPDIILRLKVFPEEKIRAAWVRPDVLQIRAGDHRHHRYHWILWHISLHDFNHVRCRICRSLIPRGPRWLREMTGKSEEEFQPLIWQWSPPSGEIEAGILHSGCHRRDIGRLGFWLLEGQKERDTRISSVSKWQTSGKK